MEKIIKPQIADFICNIENKDNITIDWKQTYQNLSRVCERLSMNLVMLYLEVLYRTEEEEEEKKEEGNKRLSSVNLRIKNERKIFKYKAKIEADGADISYFPILTPFNDEKAFEHLRVYLTNNFKFPDNLYVSKNLESVLHCAVVLKVSFQSLITKEVCPVNISIKLLSIFWDLVLIVNDFSNKWSEKERIADRKSNNTAGLIPKRIKKYRQHERYPELELMLRNYRGTSKEKREIDQLIGKIIVTFSSGTIRSYRRIFLQEIQD